MVVVAVTGCASSGLPGASPRLAARANKRIAVFPIENLSGAPAPFKDLRLSMTRKMKQHGMDLLGDEELDRFMEKNRVRYIGGLSGPTAEAFRKEADTDAVLITSLERYDETFPAKISLLCRLVSTGEHPSILWMDRVGISGYDSPGILGFGIIEDPSVLTDKALTLLTDSLAGYLSAAEKKGGGVAAGRKSQPEGLSRSPVTGYFYPGGAAGGQGSFSPRVEYRSLVIRPDKRYRVAVLPFQDLSTRKNAGEIVALEFVGQLSKLGNVSVVEPGVIREEMLNKRIIMSGGVSLADVDLLSDYPEVDLIVSGTVFDYQDYIGFGGKPKVDFSAQVIDRKSKQLVWASESRNEGDDGVLFFDLGRINTANAMAAVMVGHTVGQMMSE